MFRIICSRPESYRKSDIAPYNLFLIPLSILNKMNNNIAAKNPNLNK